MDRDFDGYLQSSANLSSMIVSSRAYEVRFHLFVEYMSDELLKDNDNLLCFS